ncbi:glyceraldehyde-3-phosphate dehydrogenase [Mycetocola tolaasinivorans]|uniref:Glyceraldehyde-3-phosphate dehydrogenase n=1 Tax=Mycetocola tolaasinivorans TaxID=76635 RepID=A0A3L7ADG9_9MICO|nr:glyceraldehyde-3-phosphate dehydrogenase [Mycetocola tolaasinivorans]RLP78024.1 glyceraldehyde-3-phosphate dehydrogenase [Mycetocola tolaasinivorans]
MDTDIREHRRRWLAQEAAADRIVSRVGALYRTHGVVTSLGGRRLIGLASIDVLGTITRTAVHPDDLTGVDRELADLELILDALTEIEPGPVSLDLTALSAGWRREGGTDPVRHLRAALDLPAGVSPAAGAGEQRDHGEARDVVLYGFGRIGRILARLLITHAGGGHGLRLRAIVVRPGGENDLKKRASLLRHDSVHGDFPGTVTVDEANSSILANGTLIRVISAADPESIDYAALGIHDAIIVDNTGRFRDAAGLERHLAAPGAGRVLLTAPGRGAIKNVVFGVNDDTITAEDRILSAASCTTNAITPVLRVLQDAYGVDHGHVETVHSFTNDQNLIDNFHTGDRRGRSAALNMVLTETGAATAVAKAIPALAGKLTGSSIRVPTPNVSLAVLNLELETATTRDEVNERLHRVAASSTLRQQIDFVAEPELVSSDLVGSHRAGIVDGLATIVRDKNLILYVWYDNEFGYSCQVMRVLERMAGAHPRVLPARVPA